MAETLYQTPVALSIAHETDLKYCREVVGLERGHPYPAGLVLGKVTATGLYAPHDPTASDGREQEAGLLIFRQSDDSTLPVAGPAIEAVALVRGPATVGAATLVRHSAINTPAEVAAQDAALMERCGIRVRAQV